ncbi:MAG: hypothetical protein ABIU29_01105 [Chthoniobacterales bacterium]
MIKTIPNLLGIAALLRCALGALIFFEVLRPLRDLSIDGPIALGSWGVGAALGISSFFLKGRSLALSFTSAAANILPLIAAFVLLWVLSHSNFAWH